MQNSVPEQVAMFMFKNARFIASALSIAAGHLLGTVRLKRKF